MAMPDIVLCKEDEIFLYKADGGNPELLSIRALQTLKEGYILVLPDSLITLIGTNIEPVKKRKLQETVRLFIEGVLPEQEPVEDDFCYFMTTPVIACLFTPRFKETFNRLGELFERASLITTPSAVALMAQSGTFFLRTEKTCLIKDEKGFVHIHGEVDGYDTESLERIIDLSKEGYDWVVDKIKELYRSGAIQKINIKKALGQEHKGILASIKWDILIWFLFYLMLLSSVFLKVLPVKKEINAYEQEIEKIYRKTGVSGEADPYGMLLFRVKKLKDAVIKGGEPLRIMLAVTDAFSKRGTVESISLGREYLRIKGQAESLEALDSAINLLKSRLKLEFKTESAKVGKEGVSFSIAGRIKE